MNLKSSLALGIVCLLLPQVGAGATIDQNWESRFILAPGLNGPVFSLLAMGTNLYAGGAFSTAGVSNTVGIARWDGGKWNAVGGGIQGVVSALVTDGTNLYAGGRFDSAGGVIVTNLAKWNGCNWSNIGGVNLSDSLNPGMVTVNALLWEQGLYVAGMFTKAGGVSATNVARWDGQNWHALGHGLGVFSFGNEIFQVFSLAKHNNNLYAGGLFHRSGGAGVTNLARWTGNNWEQVGDGVRGGGWGVYFQDEEAGYILSGVVYALGSSPDGLLVGGDFSEAGGVVATNLALYDGTNWNAIGGFTDGHVYRIAAEGTNQFCLGNFTTIGGIQASGIAAWNGAAWNPIGSGVAAAGGASARVGTKLYVGGDLQIAGGQSAGHIASWNGNAWEALISGEGNAPSDFVRDLTFGEDGSLYVVGGFATAGKVRANGVARYNGTNWFAFGNGFPERNVWRLELVDTNIYVLGNFTRPTDGVSNLARWNGSSWVSVGGGLSTDGNPPSISDFTAAGTNLYVRGYFNTAGGLPVSNLACWDGSAWSAVPQPNTDTCVGNIAAMTALGNDLLACVQGDCLQLQKWDGLQWSPISSLLEVTSLTNIYPLVQINGICSAGTNVYVGGHFIATNGMLATNLVRWDGLTWSGVNQPLDPYAQISALTSDGTNLFVCEGSYASTITEARLAKWDGVTWKILGTGITSFPNNPWILCAAARNGELVVGGGFNFAGGKPANNLAIWRDLPAITLSNRGWLAGGHFGLSISGGKSQSVQLQTSPDLQNWTSLGSLLPDTDPYLFEDLNPATNTARFYRLLLVP